MSPVLSQNARADDKPASEVMCDWAAADPDDVDYIDGSASYLVSESQGKAGAQACAEAEGIGRECTGSAALEDCTLVSRECLRFGLTPEEEWAECTKNVPDAGKRRFTYQLGRALDWRDGEFTGRAIPIYMQAAKLGSVASMRALGSLFMSSDFKRARFWYEKAAEHEDVYAMLVLGDIYKDGLGVAVDREKSRRWYSQAMKKGNAEASAKLGMQVE